MEIRILLKVCWFEPQLKWVVVMVIVTEANEMCHLFPYCKNPCDSYVPFEHTLKTFLALVVELLTPANRAKLNFYQ